MVKKYMDYLKEVEPETGIIVTLFFVSVATFVVFSVALAASILF